MPTFKVAGKGVAGFAAHAEHCGYLPMSGSVTTALSQELAGYATTQGSVKSDVDQCLPQGLVAALVGARLAELGIEQ